MADEFCPGYSIVKGSSLDRALLVKAMQRTYKELHPEQSVAHLAHTVDQYLSNDTLLWWVEVKRSTPSGQIPRMGPSRVKQPIACLWLGDAIDQIEGDRHAYVFLLYVEPNHRRKGIASALMAKAVEWAKARGDRKISLQVFSDNQPALMMYEKLGYRVQSFWMTRAIADTLEP